MTRKQEQIISIILNILTLWLISFNNTCSKYQTKYFGKFYYKGTYNEFKNSFNKINWEFDHNWPNSLFVDYTSCDYYGNYIHAGILYINNVGYILTTYGYIRAKKLIRKKINSLRSPITL